MHHPGPTDLVDYVAKSTWAELNLEGLDVLDNDLAIDGVRIDKVEHGRFRNVLSLTQERHQAFNWLLGFETLFSHVTTDT
jgi:hypothetical protein